MFHFTRTDKANRLLFLALLLCACVDSTKLSSEPESLAEPEALPAEVTETTESGTTDSENINSEEPDGTTPAIEEEDSAEATVDETPDDNAETGTEDSATEPCNFGPAVPGEDITLEFPWDGEMRTWILHLPADYDCTPRPLLLGAHAYLSDGHSFQHDVAQIFDHINTHGYIGIFPDAMARSDSEADVGVTSFNDGTSHYDEGPDGPTCTLWSWDYGIFSNCGPEEEERFCRWGTSCADDEGFFRALIAHVSNLWTVDAARIYMTGFSQGAITTQSFACPLSDILAAIAPLHGASANGYTCGPETKVSMMQVWGVNDIGINGHGEPSIDGLIYDGADETALVWAEAQNCDPEPTPYTTVSDGKWGWQCNQHANCETGADVVNCQWDGNHFWGRSPLYGDFMWDAVWDFLSSHSR